MPHIGRHRNSGGISPSRRCTHVSSYRTNGINLRSPNPTFRTRSTYNQLKICVSLLPSDIGDIYAGIRRNIYQFLMRYNEPVGGVLLAVSDLSFADGEREGRINDEMPHIHFDVKAKAQVFRPRPGHILEGRVNKVRPRLRRAFGVVCVPALPHTVLLCTHMSVVRIFVSVYSWSAS